MKGDWICLEFRRSALRSKFGIVVRDEEAMPVGEKGVSLGVGSGFYMNPKNRRKTGLFEKNQA